MTFSCVWDIWIQVCTILANWIKKFKATLTNVLNRSVLSTYLSEVFENVVDDDLLGLVGVYSGERIHVNDCVFKPNQRKAQGAFQSLG